MASFKEDNRYLGVEAMEAAVRVVMKLLPFSELLQCIASIKANYSNGY